MISCNGTVVGGRLPRVCNGRRGRQEPNRQEKFVGDRCDEKETDFSVLLHKTSMV